MTLLNLSTDFFRQARILSVLGGIGGWVAGFVYSFGGLLHDMYFGMGINGGTALAFLALIGMPLIAASFGFILGVFGALLTHLMRRLQ